MRNEFPAHVVVVDTVTLGTNVQSHVDYLLLNCLFYLCIYYGISYS